MRNPAFPDLLASGHRGGGNPGVAAGTELVRHLREPLKMSIFKNSLRFSASCMVDSGSGRLNKQRLSLMTSRNPIKDTKMNRTYRKVFNAVRGAMVAVAENVSAANQRGSVTVGTTHKTKAEGGVNTNLV